MREGFLFALISEVPFDLAFSRRMWNFPATMSFYFAVRTFGDLGC